jgi:phosphatidylglycerophosphatase A
LGYTPIGGGTVAAAVGFIIFFVFNLFKVPILIYTIGIILFSLLCLLTADYAERTLHLDNKRKKDPRPIVIDEFLGSFYCLFGIESEITQVIFLFVIYRMFDIIKFPFIHYLQRLKGGWGIILDDIAAAILANLIIRILYV